MTPFQKWTGKKPDLSLVRIFGSKVHILKVQRQKWDKQAEKFILVGYPDDVKGYILYNPKTRKITTSKDVIIIEKQDSDTAQVVVNEQEENKEENPEKEENTEGEDHSSEKTFVDTDDPTHVCDSSSSLHDSYQSVSETEKESIIEEEVPVEVSKRQIKPVKRYGVTNLDDLESGSGELSYEAVMNRLEKEQRRLVICMKRHAFDDNQAWEFVDRS